MVSPRVISLLPSATELVCGLTLERTLRERSVIERVIVPALPRGARVYVADGSAFFNRPGPRLVESLEIVAACTHPERFVSFWDESRSDSERLALRIY